MTNIRGSLNRNGHLISRFGLHIKRVLHGPPQDSGSSVDSQELLLAEHGPFNVKSVRGAMLMDRFALKLQKKFKNLFVHKD
jgi:hypothetical protein